MLFLKPQKIMIGILLTYVCLLTACKAQEAPPSKVTDKILAIENGLRPALQTDGHDKVRWSLQDRMKYYRVPGVSLAIIENGAIVYAKGYGIKGADGKEKVDTKTVFSVGSLSKVGTAVTVLRLAQEGLVDLDTDVNTYLTRWKVPANSYQGAVTLRGVLSHTGGLTVSGFPDFNPDDTLPTLLDTLNGVAPSRTGPVEVFYEPGSTWSYSGGGTTVAQLLVEDITKQTFTAVTKQKVFDVLGMQRSTYQNPLPASFGNIAKAHNDEGQVIALPQGWHSFPESAASGLWTTPSDYARMMIALMNSYKGRESDFLPQTLSEDMMTEVAYSMFGIGPMLTGTGNERRFMHSGSNESYKAWMEGHLETGDGLVIFTNSPNGRKLYLEIRRAVADAFGWPYYAEKRVPNVQVSAASMEQFSGTYKVKNTHFDASSRVFGAWYNNGKLTIEIKDGALMHGDWKLVPVGKNVFICDGQGCDTKGDVTYEFITDTDGITHSLSVHQDRSVLSLIKMQKPQH